jgi:hypothetical protein
MLCRLHVQLGDDIGDGVALDAGGVPPPPATGSRPPLSVHVVKARHLKPFMGASPLAHPYAMVSVGLEQHCTEPAVGGDFAAPEWSLGQLVFGRLAARVRAASDGGVDSDDDEMDVGKARSVAEASHLKVRFGGNKLKWWWLFDWWGDDEVVVAGGCGRPLWCVCPWCGCWCCVHVWCDMRYSVICRGFHCCLCPTRGARDWRQVEVWADQQVIGSVSVPLGFVRTSAAPGATPFVMDGWRR